MIPELIDENNLFRAVLQRGTSQGDAYVAERALDVFRVSDGVNTYIAEAAPGAALNAPVWRVRRVTYGVDGGLKIRWVGTGAFAYAANAMSTLTYPD